MLACRLLSAHVHLALAADTEPALACDHVTRRHFAHRQGAGLVTADDLRTAEGLDGRQASHQRMV